MKRWLPLPLLVIGMTVTSPAQTPRPTFEVASIKKLDQPVTFRGFPPQAIRGGTVTRVRQ